MKIITLVNERIVGALVGGKLNSPCILRTSGGTISHISVIRNSYENIVRDVIEPRRGKKARIAKEYGLYGLYIGRRSIKP